ncbi:helix-turn-helix domain-containing protein [Haloferax sp. ATB1]|uniref:winged helix-turn-helix transcriptional regulator n=1 Tax=Haloferax sp. ATB1 TaxID=1508454 RepID=UPI0005B228AB|nr:helix-turn-helix domain-containing protein [Haloferax sp. ATB1]
MDQADNEFVFDPVFEGEGMPVTDVIGLTRRKWTRTIIERLLVEDGLRYNELNERIDGISDKVLSESLEALEDHHLVRRTVIDDRPVKVEYSLTEAGTALEQVIEAVDEWTDSYLDYLGQLETS